MKSCTKFLVVILASAASLVLFPSCVSTPEKPHVYDFGTDEDVSKLPHTRPEKNIDGGAYGNMPQSR